MNYYCISYCSEHTKCDPDADGSAVQLWYQNDYVAAATEFGAKEQFRKNHILTFDSICEVVKISKEEYDRVVTETNTPFGMIEETSKLKYFTDKGNVKCDTKNLDSLFDEDGHMYISVYEEVIDNYAKFPGDSEIAGFYWLNQAASETHGNYSPETFVNRCCDFVESRRNK